MMALWMQHRPKPQQSAQSLWGSLHSSPLPTSYGRPIFFSCFSVILKIFFFVYVNVAKENLSFLKEQISPAPTQLHFSPSSSNGRLNMPMESLHSSRTGGTYFFLVKRYKFICFLLLSFGVRNFALQASYINRKDINFSMLFAS